MPLHPAYAQVSALLGAVFILIFGNGLSNTLIPLSATAAAFPPLSIGLIGSAYFGGMLVGCIAAPRIIARAGHIRAFSAFVVIATFTTLLHPIFVDPAAWGGIRAFTGFCFAGLYATIESWMHDKADNVVRGRVLAIYQIVHYAGSAIGQQAIRLIVEIDNDGAGAKLRDFLDLTDLRPGADENHPEGASLPHATADHVDIAWFEDPQRQEAFRKQHRIERKQGQLDHAPLFPSGWGLLVWPCGFGASDARVRSSSASNLPCRPPKPPLLMMRT